ncbi:phosphoglucomutase [Ceraceosorus bombacis]|uniref:phosphoglucomutase (alpha-D-glucose-1,6-bisphosphate-dependent) n=1 Tax=Ceraceosorus bombacis TaxID=401625 RepID=A0A0P1BRA9_9BASI|nr:phosphoglucomutase [Ceraceosorus bombacis]
MSVQTIPTKPFEGQKPGTSGLRKRTKVFSQPHYVENFIQATLDSFPNGTPKSLVVGGDGRYFSLPAIQSIINVAAGNGVQKLIIGQNGILSTPAVSHLIRLHSTDGGILLTASHNPGGPEADFGIKANLSSGQPAGENVTDAIYKKTTTIQEYKVVQGGEVDLSKLGHTKHGNLAISVVDSVSDYIQYLSTIFDFDLIKQFLQSGSFTVRFDALHGVTGPYGRALFIDAFGLPESAIQNCVPSPTFNGGHPDPNLTYAKSLVDAVEKENISFGAASDGDGDRNMIIGKGAFVNPSDSVAIIAEWASKGVIPYFNKSGGVKGLARSMPTSGALDRVAKEHNLPFFEVPTGWKFFGNLMDAGKLSICGEESFGTGSDHIREKDGLWAVVAWLSILAAANKEKPGTSVQDVLQAHYQKYGRNFFSRYDYEEVDSAGAKTLMDDLAAKFGDASFAGSKLGEFEVKSGELFEYKDPVDGSVSKNQEKYSKDPSEYAADAQVGLKPLIDQALALSQLQKHTGRDKPTVIT